MPNGADLRAARWADNALGQARAKLAAGPLADVVLSPPTVLPASGRRAVEVVLRLRRATCLERALVRQRWLAAHGVARQVVIGVGSPSEGFRAHAWLEGEDDIVSAQFSELTRLAP
jgi:hypothetical protein